MSAPKALRADTLIPTRSAAEKRKRDAASRKGYLAVREIRLAERRANRERWKQQLAWASR